NEIEGILAPEGYPILCVRTARLALAAIATSSTPRLILADFRMPRMDGLELCRRLKADKRSAAIPLIFLAASTDVKQCVEGFALGAADFIAKPFRPEEVIARVRIHLEVGVPKERFGLSAAKPAAAIRAMVAKLQREIVASLHVERAMREGE